MGPCAQAAWRRSPGGAKRTRVHRVERSLALRPNDVATRSYHDAILQGAVKTLGEFGKAEIFDGLKPLATQHFGERRRIKQTEPGFATRSRARRHRDHIVAAIGPIVFKWLAVIENDLRVRHPGD